MNRFGRKVWDEEHKEPTIKIKNLIWRVYSVWTNSEGELMYTFQLKSRGANIFVYEERHISFNEFWSGTDCWAMSQ